ncbi:MAG: endonuclease Q family protein [Desulfitobacterium hafniense]|nr:endonuclease Q family protein [Desulfitobacterium hafniense]
MNNSFADLHIHIGQSLDGKAVKITAAKSLTLSSIIATARDIKGLSLIGIVDCHSTGVRKDLFQLLNTGDLEELSGGGYTSGGLTLIPGTEIELAAGEGTAHFLAYFADVDRIGRYVKTLKPYVKNWQLSSQKAYVTVADWLEVIAECEGIWMPAHAFTPHKGIYGNCCRRMLDVLPVLPKALEIGLSADRSMANQLSELDNVILFSNSDAHSLPNIAREYNQLSLVENSFLGLKELVEENRGAVVRNFGLPPQVGKYHRTYCLVCERVVEGVAPVYHCSHCGSNKIVPGVLDRLVSIADKERPGELDSRYVHQVQLRQLPGVGPKMYDKLLQTFGTEMNVLHHAELDELIKAGGEKVAAWILKARQGDLIFEAGGGGVFGRVKDILSD